MSTKPSAPVPVPASASPAAPAPPVEPSEEEKVDRHSLFLRFLLGGGGGGYEYKQYPGSVTTLPAGTPTGVLGSGSGGAVVAQIALAYRLSNRWAVGVAVIAASAGSVSTEDHMTRWPAEEKVYTGKASLTASLFGAHGVWFPWPDRGWSATASAGILAAGFKTPEGRSADGTGVGGALTAGWETSRKAAWNFGVHGILLGGSPEFRTSDLRPDATTGSSPLADKTKVSVRMVGIAGSATRW